MMKTIPQGQLEYAVILPRRCVLSVVLNRSWMGVALSHRSGRRFEFEFSHS